MWMRTTLSKGTVLVVDDERLMVDFLTDALSEQGYCVRVAVGVAAPRFAADLQPDLILLDIMMPGLDGVEVCRLLRANPRTRDIPVIAVSATRDLRAQADAMHVDDYLAKPFDLDTLTRFVQRWTRPSPLPHPVCG